MAPLGSIPCYPGGDAHPGVQYHIYKMKNPVMPLGGPFGILVEKIFRRPQLGQLLFPGRLRHATDRVGAVAGFQGSKKQVRDAKGRQHRLGSKIHPIRRFVP